MRLIKHSTFTRIMQPNQQINNHNFQQISFPADITKDREDVSCKYIALAEVQWKLRFYVRVSGALLDFSQQNHIIVSVINRNDRRSNGGVAGAQQPNAQQQQQLQPSQRQQQLANLQPNSIKQVNKVRPNVNRQPTDSRDAISPSTYNRWIHIIHLCSLFFFFYL